MATLVNFVTALGFQLQTLLTRADVPECFGAICRCHLLIAESAVDTCLVLFKLFAVLAQVVWLAATAFAEALFAFTAAHPVIFHVQLVKQLHYISFVVLCPEVKLAGHYFHHIAAWASGKSWAVLKHLVNHRFIDLLLLFFSKVLIVFAW